MIAQRTFAAGACSGNGILFDIADPLNPKRIDAVTDTTFAYWHSATFNNDGTKVIFTDEWGGGGRPRCKASDPKTWGANAIYDIVDGKLVFRAHYKLPAPQSDMENCVAHNGSIIPVPGRDLFAQAWYQGGLSVMDFTDSANPQEIAYFDRGPIDKQQLVPLIKAAIGHRGAAFIDVVSPCVAFNNHPGSTKSYDYVRAHNEAVNRLDFAADAVLEAQG